MEAEHEDMNDDLYLEVKRHCDNVPLPMDFYRMSLTRFVMPYWYRNQMQRQLDFEVRNDDIYLIGPPRCGTTWVQEMIWILKNNFDFKQAKDTLLFHRFPSLTAPSVARTPTDMIDFVNKKSSPRFIKSHLHKPNLPKQLWTKNPKIVFVFRNPKDAAISLYHLYRSYFGYRGPMELVLKSFVNDAALGNPFWEFVLSFWLLRHETNILFLTYEEMKKDTSAAVKKVAEFLEVKYTQEEETALLNHLKISSMKNNESINLRFVLTGLSEEDGCGFIRKGEVAGWKKEMSSDMVKMFDQWTEDKLKGSDFPRDNL